MMMLVIRYREQAEDPKRAERTTIDPIKARMMMKKQRLQKKVSRRKRWSREKFWAQSLVELFDSGCARVLERRLYAALLFRPQDLFSPFITLSPWLSFTKKASRAWYNLLKRERDHIARGADYLNLNHEGTNCVFCSSCAGPDASLCADKNSATEPTTSSWIFVDAGGTG